MKDEIFALGDIARIIIVPMVDWSTTFLAEEISPIKQSILAGTTEASEMFLQIFENRENGTSPAIFGSWQMKEFWRKVGKKKNCFHHKFREKNGTSNRWIWLKYRIRAFSRLWYSKFHSDSILILQSWIKKYVAKFYNQIDFTCILFIEKIKKKSNKIDHIFFI